MPLLMEDTSITGRAYHLLRAELISCRLKPGTRLNISSLQKKLSLSQAAVREALSRLTSEGLVEFERHRGFRVASISQKGYRERSEEHTSELQSLMRISYAVFCLKKKTKRTTY